MKHLNTSHVIFYREVGVVWSAKNGDLNTSHVIFYLKWSNIPAKDVAFKYISCYFLSDHNGLSSQFAAVFKYISCYFLSNGIIAISMLEHNLNTSHVIFYHLYV